MNHTLIRLLNLAGPPAHLEGLAVSGQAFLRPRFAANATPLEPPPAPWRTR